MFQLEVDIHSFLLSSFSSSFALGSLVLKFLSTSQCSYMLTVNVKSLPQIGSTDQDPTNDDGEGDKNIDYAIR